MQYDESDDRMSISAPMVEASYDFNTDYNLKANFMFDSVSGATPTINENSGTYTQGLQEFEDERKALSLMLTSRFENRDELYTGFEVSQEEDYESKSFSAEYMHYLDATHNTAISVGASVNFNEILHFDATAGPSPFANYDSNSGASYTEESTTYNI